MIPVGRQYQTVRELRDDLAELLATELGKFPNNLPAIWVEDRQSRTVSDGVAVIIQDDFVPFTTRARMGHQSDTSGEWVVVLRSFGTEEQFRTAKEKMRVLPHSMRETPLPYREGVVRQVTFRIQATITRNTWQ